jgi:hypothetical protein
MKATLRKNGDKMFTLTLKVHVGRDGLIQAVIIQLLLEDPNDPPPRSRKSVIEATRKGFERYGEGFWYATEKCDGEAEAREQATQIVERLFPELKS